LDEPPSYKLLEIFYSNNVLHLFVTVTLLLLGGLLSLIESALFSLKPQDIESFQNSKNKGDKLILELLANPRQSLTALIAWKYVMLICAAVIFTIAIRLTERVGFLVEILILTIAFTFFSIIIPKIYGTANNTAIIRKAGKICLRLITIIKPFIKPLLTMSYKVERKLEELSEENTAKELTQVLELAAADKETTDDERAILKGIVNFGTLTVKQVMRPRNEINSTDISMNFHDLLIYIKKSGFSRIPIYRDTEDKIEGVLYIKDLLPYLDEHKKFPWHKLLRPAYFVQENKKIDLLLKDFQEKRVHMALASKDSGEISGLVTLEDLIEEIIGDIHDEFDEVGAFYKKIDEKTFMIDSKIPVHEFCRIVNVEPTVFDSVKGENETLGGFLAEIQNDLPKIGDQIVIDPFIFIIEAVDHKRVKKIKVHLQEPKDI
jgi:putative hemolysin